MSLPQIVQGYIPVISINGQMYALVPTVETVSYSGTVTLAYLLYGQTVRRPIVHVQTSIVTRELL